MTAVLIVAGLGAFLRWSEIGRKVQRHRHDRGMS